MITFRLGDSLPVETWLRWKAKLEHEEPEAQRRSKRLRDAVENYLDRGQGSCLFRDPGYARLVEESLLYFDGQRYRIMGWVVMPNHVHALIEIWDGFPLMQIVHSWKSYTSHEIGKLRPLAGTLWQADYFDRFIRDEKHFHRALFYIENNPVKAGLCTKPEDWPFSSARFR